MPLARLQEMVHECHSAILFPIKQMQLFRCQNPLPIKHSRCWPLGMPREQNNPRVWRQCEVDKKLCIFCYMQLAEHQMKGRQLDLNGTAEGKFFGIREEGTGFFLDGNSVMEWFGIEFRWMI